MVEVRKYHLAPTSLIPNSPHPLLHYPGFLLNQHPKSGDRDQKLEAEVEETSDTDRKERCNPLRVHDLFARNGWQTQWVFRYGQTQSSHYHSAVHECMAVLSGTATIRFGVADLPSSNATEKDSEHNDHNKTKEESNDTAHRLDHKDSQAGLVKPTANDHADTQEPGGIEIEAHAGDVFVLPAGVAHKTFNTHPVADFALLTPGDGHSMAIDPSTSSHNGGHHNANEDVRRALSQVEPSGYTMIGAYPMNTRSAWDFSTGGENVGGYEDVWSVVRPELDPVLGRAEEGVCGQWLQ